MPLLFCYGSNSPAQLEERIGAPRSTAAAYAPGYKRVFRGWSSRWEGGVASLVRSTARPAYGYVAEVTQAQLAQMDRYEGVGVGAYERRVIPVVIVDPETDEEMEVDAVAYVSLSREFNQPSPDYLRAVLRTLRAFWDVPGGVKDIKVE